MPGATGPSPDAATSMPHWWSSPAPPAPRWSRVAALRAATEHPDGVDAEFDGLGTIRARWAIGADGMWSPLRKALGLADSDLPG